MDSMKYSERFLAILSALIVLPGAAQAEKIEYYTFPSAPYQVVSETPAPDAHVQGLTVDVVRCTTASAGRQSRVRAAPQKRAVRFLTNDLIDGYFAVDPSLALDELAFRSNPVSLEKWHLVSRSGSKPSAKPRIGAVSGSNEEAWLLSQGRDIFLSVRTAEQLIALLERGRIDQALMDQRVLANLSGTDNLTSRFLRYVPLHVYFSSDFVGRNPGFVDAFNAHIPGCINAGFDLDKTESAQISATAHDLFRSLEAQVPPTAAIEAGPDTTSLSEILNLDAQWQALAPRQHSEMARFIASQEASIAMNRWQKNHQSLVTEVMLTNSIGALVAMSGLSSDFWQGDEAKFEHHIRKDANSLYISPVYYDESTSRFQVVVSKPIIAEDRWIPLGVLVIGLDVEEALAGTPDMVSDR